MTSRNLATEILTVFGKIDYTSVDYPKWLSLTMNSVREHLALYLRRDLERNGISERFFKGVKIELTKVDKANFCKVQSGCQILRSVNPLPEYVRLKSDVSFPFVGTIDRSRVFKQLELEYSKYVEYSEVLKKPICWYIRDNYIWLFNATRMQYILIDMIPLSSSVDAICNNIASCTDDEELFVSEDIIGIIKEEVLKQLKS